MRKNFKNKLKFNDMIGKYKNPDNTINNIITSVNMLINPKNFKNSNIQKFYKNNYSEKGKNILGNYQKGTLNKISHKTDFNKRKNNSLKDILNNRLKENTKKSPVNYKKDSSLFEYGNISEKNSFYNTYSKNNYKSGTSEFFNINKNFKNNFLKEKSFAGNTEKRTLFKNGKNYVSPASYFFKKAHNYILPSENKKETVGIKKIITGSHTKKSPSFSLINSDKREQALSENTISIRDFNNSISGFNKTEKDFTIKKNITGLKSTVNPAGLFYKIKNNDFNEESKNLKFKKFREDSYSKSQVQPSNNSFTISPNINVEIKPQNPAADFNKIWTEIGNRLNSEINSSVNGFHMW